MREELFISQQDLAQPREVVFRFFADPANLERLTPPWLGFSIRTPAPLPQGEGAVFDYQLNVRGMRLHWRTLIEYRVRYRVGWGFLGRLVTALWVKPDVARIFEYRKATIARLLGPA